jgi:hypothetical protein
MAKSDLIPMRGAVAEPLVMETTRDLTGEDLSRLATAPKVGVPILQKLRATHHRQAMLLAEGKTPTQVAAIVGCTTARLTQLMDDPTFMELLTNYQDQMVVAHLADAARLKAKIVDLGEMAVDELTERMEDDQRRVSMPVSEVRKIAEFAMDRTVAPPQAAPNAQIAPAVITMNFGTPIRHPEDRDDAIPKTIEGTVSDLPVP